MEYDYLYGNAQGNSAFATPQSSMDLEWVLKPNTNYVYKLENLTDATTAIFLAKLIWYEH